MHKKILVTGGTGFIGSHTCILLLQQEFKVIIVDNLSNSDENTISKIKQVSGKDDIIFYQQDLCNNIDNIFEEHDIYAVIHFGALKSVKESIKDSLFYYQNNIISTINLIHTMMKYNCYRLIFSSSATVYGTLKSPLKETDITGIGITNPYGQTKHMIEVILKDICFSYPNMNIVSLRYFNPIGCHSSGIIGDNPKNIPNNIMPYILKVAEKNSMNIFSEGYDFLPIYGNDYDTPDGTCIRDYIHVMDVAESHIIALNEMNNMKINYNVFNIGKGAGISVIELINIFIETNKVKIPFKIMNRREGDIPIVYCDTSKSLKELGFKPKYSIADMCRDSWNNLVYSTRTN